MNCLVVAMTKDRVIGKNGALPWHIPSDLKHFKAITSYSTVVMGKNTFLSLNRPNGLPNRNNIVISSSAFEHGDDVIVVPSLEAAYNKYKYKACPTCFIGGGMLYKSVLDADIISEMHISEIKGEYEGDTYFPSFDESKWELTKCEDREDFLYKVLTRKR